MINYSSLTDEELLSLYKQNDARALEVLTEKYMQTAKYIALSFKGHSYECSDLVQEGMIGFLSAVYAYNEEHKTKFATFASACIRNRIISCLRSKTAKSSVPEELIVPLEEQQGTLCYGLTPEETLVSEKSSEYISKAISSSLSKQEQTAFRLYLAGMSYEEISHELEISAKAVDGTLQRARKKLREKLRELN